MRKILLATLTAGVLSAGAANALTATGTFQVTATVQATCSTNAAALAFPNYTPGAGAVTANTTINVRCSKSTPYSVSLNAGSTTGGTIGQRLMTSGGTNTLQYNLFTSGTFATIFGDGTLGSQPVTGTGNGVATPTTHTVFGQLPDSAANQAATPGAYADTITITVTY